MRPFNAHCQLLGRTGESPYSTRIHAETPEQALVKAQSAADAYADSLNVARTKLTIRDAESGRILVDEP